jgi:SAM-dependent methyltransferase
VTRPRPDPEAAAPPADPARAYARRLAAASLADGDDTGWFETLYAAAERGDVTVPWADLAPNPHIVSELAGLTGPAGISRALVIGCGLGDDAEHVASHGFTTVAFDVSPTAVAVARRRFPDSPVEYVTADLLSPPLPWAAAFDLVVEAYTLQVLTGDARRTGIARTADLVAPGGRLLVVARARDEHDDPGTMPWPLTRQELESFADHGLVTDSIAGVVDDEDGRQIRRWRAWFTRPPLRNRLP